jgi:hypothetical protein
MPAFSFAFFKRKAAPSLQCVLACVYLSSYVVIFPLVQYISDHMALFTALTEAILLSIVSKSIICKYS